MTERFISGKLKNIFRVNFHKQLTGDDRWKACLAAGGGAKRRYQYCTDISGTIIYFRALQGHSGHNLIDPSLQEECDNSEWILPTYLPHLMCLAREMGSPRQEHNKQRQTHEGPEPACVQTPFLSRVAHAGREG